MDAKSNANSLPPAPVSDLHVTSYAPISSTRECPDCGGHLIRTRRRAIDHVLNVLVQVRRYRCSEFHCQWEGNLRVSRLFAGRGSVPQR